MSQRRFKIIAIALGIVCIALVGGLIGAISVYSSMVSDRDSEISALNQQIAATNSQIANSTLIINLVKSVTWVPFQNVTIQAGYELGWNATALYAGYVSVQVYTSSSSNTKVHVTYSSHGVNYDSTIIVGMGGTAVFPVLPATVNVSVINPDTTDATARVNIVYYY